MNWRQPFDNFGRQLADAREKVLANLTEPWPAVESFEAILEDLRDHSSDRDEKLIRVRELGRQLFNEIRSRAAPVAMEVRHYCWHLQYLGDPSGSPASSVLDVLMTTLTRFAAYESHLSSRCSICAEFGDDIPYGGDRDRGRDHFCEWLRRRGFEVDDE